MQDWVAFHLSNVTIAGWQKPQNEEVMKEIGWVWKTEALQFPKNKTESTNPN